MQPINIKLEDRTIKTKFMKQKKVCFIYDIIQTFPRIVTNQNVNRSLLRL